MLKKYFIFFIVLLFLVFPIFVLAEAGNPPAGNPPTNTNAQGTVTLDNPLGKGKTDVPTLLGTVVNYVMGIIGSLALVMFIYGGATWMLSGGNQEMVTRGKQTLIWAAIGIVIIFTAYALVRFVIQAITNT